MVDFKGAHFEKDIILTCVRWYVAYPLSYRQLEAAFHRRKRPVEISSRMDETYIRVRGNGAIGIVRWTRPVKPSTFC
jgi:transposase-like protein